LGLDGPRNGSHCEGATFALSAELSIGRDPCNTTFIPDATWQLAFIRLGEKERYFSFMFLKALAVFW
jgi:hypothetical protein